VLEAWCSEEVMEAVRGYVERTLARPAGEQTAAGSSVGLPSAPSRRSSS